MRRVRLYLSFCCAVSIAFLVPAVFAQSPSIPTLAVDAATNVHPIDPNIYGIASFGLDPQFNPNIYGNPSYSLDPQFAQEIRVPNVRWGGDTTTQYNWLVDSSNMGFDWFFLGGGIRANSAPGASVDQMISTFGAFGARPLVTIPIIPFINGSAAPTCSFPVSVYGPQQEVDPYDHPGGQTCGNGVSLYGIQLIDNDIYSNHVDNSVSLQQGWIEHLVSTFGTAANGGVPYYELDNEPSGWFNTHRDVMPNGADYPEIVALGEEYAAMIKQSDPSASVFGPSDFSGRGWVGNPKQQNNLYAGQYYLQQMAAYEQQHSRRILDYFDEHYYPSSFDDASELASTRTLWDPTYLGSGGSVFNAPVDLIPRFKKWIQQYYPGTKLSISEYGFSSWRNPLVDALTEADVLGIFGREGLDFANMWTIPMPPAPVLSVFRIFRNYDGQGGQYGNVSVESTSSDQRRLSVYSALRSSDHALTVLVINKTTEPIATTLSLANFPASTASVYSFSAADLTRILPAGGVAVVSNQIDYDFPAYSATLFVIPDDAPLSATATVLSTSTISPKAGQTITFTANIVPASNVNMPTGTVDFVNDQTVLGTALLNSGEASLQTAALSPGPHTITASYSGDANNAASTSNILNINVSSFGDYALALSDSTLQVSSGSNATLMVTVTPQNGFAAPVAFACTGLPVGAACHFSPPSVTPQENSAAVTSMFVSVPAALSGGHMLLPQMAASDSLFCLWLVAAILCLASVKKHAGPDRVKLRSFRLLIVAAGCFCLFGCAWGGSNSNAQLSTEKHTAYIVTVTAGGANVPTHSQQFTLTVFK
jgi:Glycoside hydrolase family 44/Bacterial Ig-like domain (group 3)